MTNLVSVPIEYQLRFFKVTVFKEEIVHSLGIRACKFYLNKECQQQHLSGEL